MRRDPVEHYNERLALGKKQIADTLGDDFDLDLVAEDIRRFGRMMRWPAELVDEVIGDLKAGYDRRAFEARKN